MANIKVSEMDETTFDPTDSTGYVYYVKGSQSYKLKVKDIVDSISARGGTNISSNLLDYGQIVSFTVGQGSTESRTLSQDSVVFLVGTGLTGITIDNKTASWFPTIRSTVAQTDTEVFGYSLPKNTNISISPPSSSASQVLVGIVPYAQSSESSEIESKLTEIQTSLGQIQANLIPDGQTVPYPIKIPDWGGKINLAAINKGTVITMPFDGIVTCTHLGGETNVLIWVDGVVPTYNDVGGVEIANGSIVTLGQSGSSGTQSWALVPFKYTNINMDSVIFRVSNLQPHLFNQEIDNYSDTYGAFLTTQDIDKSIMGIYGQNVQNLPSGHTTDANDIANSEYFTRIDASCKDDTFYKYYIYTPLSNWQTFFPVAYKRKENGVRSNINLKSTSFGSDNKRGSQFLGIACKASDLQVTFNILKFQ